MELNSITTSINVKSVDRAARPESNDLHDGIRISSMAEQPVSRGNDTNRTNASLEASASNNREAEERTATTEDIVQAAAEANARVSPISAHRISFLVDEDTGKTVVRVVDAETKEVIRQIPPDEFLHMVKALEAIEQPAKGLIVDRES